jgi:feruloyl esterase
MRNYIFRSGLSAIAVITLALIARPALAATCESLTDLHLPDTTITSAVSITPPATIKGPMGKADVTTPFCRVIGVLTPTSDSQIGFEVWLPPSDAWNHKFFAVGNGGFAGALNYREMMPGFERGYATMTTDKGHVNPPDNPVENISWALGHPEKIIDYDYRAAHVTTVAAKKIIEAYYGSAPQHSYYSGCSGGGHQGVTETLRYPGDYDGYVLGDAARNHIEVDMDGLWDVLAASLSDPANAIEPPQLALVHQAVMKKCVGKDGGLETDGFLTDPRMCQYDVKELECKAGQDVSTCLTPGQVVGLKKIYEGPTNPRTHEQIDFGYLMGTESLFMNFIGKTNPAGFERPWAGILTYMVFDDPNYMANERYLKFNFDTDYKLVMNKPVKDQTLWSIFDNDNPNLEPIKKEGAKIIHYWGWMDGNDSVLHGLEYYDRVVADQAKLHHLKQEDAARETSDFYRLFLFPGMGHCGGGPGPSVFDTLTPLEKWVESGVAPDKIVATKYVDNNPKQGVEMTRPVCPYPQFARYTGSGSTTSADNFVCAAGIKSTVHDK